MYSLFLQSLISQNISHIGRASDMLCISIGHPVSTNKAGFPLSQYEIHCQCPWRIVTKGHRKILICSSDIFLPPIEQKITEDFQWDVLGNNLFDVKTCNLFSDTSSMIIEQVELIGANDLSIAFSNGIAFETFTNSSLHQECWRVFQRDQDKLHLVSYGSEITMEK